MFNSMAFMRQMVTRSSASFGRFNIRPGSEFLESAPDVLKTFRAIQPQYTGHFRTVRLLYRRFLGQVDQISRSFDLREQRSRKRFSQEVTRDIKKVNDETNKSLKDLAEKTKKNFEDIRSNMQAGLAGAAAALGTVSGVGGVKDLEDRTDSLFDTMNKLKSGMNISDKQMERSIWNRIHQMGRQLYKETGGAVGFRQVAELLQEVQQNTGIQDPARLQLITRQYELARQALGDVGTEYASFMNSMISSNIIGAESIGGITAAIQDVSGAFQVSKGDLASMLSDSKGYLTQINNLTQGNQRLNQDAVRGLLASQALLKKMGLDESETLRTIMEAATSPGGEAYQQLARLGLDPDALTRAVRAGGDALPRAVASMVQNIGSQAGSFGNNEIFRDVFGKDSIEEFKAASSQMGRYNQMLDKNATTLTRRFDDMNGVLGVIGNQRVSLIEQWKNWFELQDGVAEFLMQVEEIDAFKVATILFAAGSFLRGVGGLAGPALRGILSLGAAPFKALAPLFARGAAPAATATAASAGGRLALSGVTGLAKRIPLAGIIIDLVIGSFQYLTANTQEAKRQVLFRTGGSAIGGLVGGIAGSFLGPVGTIIGGILGSLIGGWLGDMTRRFTDWVTDNSVLIQGWFSTSYIKFKLFYVSLYQMFLKWGRDMLATWKYNSLLLLSTITSPFDTIIPSAKKFAKDFITNLVGPFRLLFSIIRPFLDVMSRVATGDFQGAASILTNLPQQLSSSVLDALRGIQNDLFRNQTEYDTDVTLRRMHRRINETTAAQQYRDAIKSSSDQYSSAVNPLVNQLSATQSAIEQSNSIYQSIRAGQKAQDRRTINPLLSPASLTGLPRASDYDKATKPFAESLTSNGNVAIADIQKNMTSALSGLPISYKPPTFQDAQLGTTAQAALANTLAQPIQHSLGSITATCAAFVNKSLETAGIAARRTNVAGQLVSDLLSRGAERVPVSQAQKGDVIVYHGKKYGAIKDDQGWGYHVGIGLGNGMFRDSRGGRTSDKRIYPAGANAESFALRLGTLGGSRNTPLGPGSVGGRRYTSEQLSIAKRIVDIGKSLGASPTQILAAMETGLVESDLRNLNRGDRDSKGVMQQRPSQDWGSISQIRDIDYAIRAFYKGAGTNKGALDYTGWMSTPGLLAQKVQRSAYPHKYDKRQAEALALIRYFNDAGTSRVQGGLPTIATAASTTLPQISTAAMRQFLGVQAGSLPSARILSDVDMIPPRSSSLQAEVTPSTIGLMADMPCLAKMEGPVPVVPTIEPRVEVDVHQDEVVQAINALARALLGRNLNPNNDLTVSDMVLQGLL